MQEKEDNSVMARIRTCTNYFGILVPVVFALSCLLIAGTSDFGDRGHGISDPGLVYSDLPKIEPDNTQENLPCADLDDYDSEGPPVFADDNASPRKEAVIDEKQEEEGPDGEEKQKTDKKEDLESYDDKAVETNDNTDADGQKEREGEREEDGERGEEDGERGEEHGERGEEQSNEEADDKVESQPPAQDVDEKQKADEEEDLVIEKEGKPSPGERRERLSDNERPQLVMVDALVLTREDDSPEEKPLKRKSDEREDRHSKLTSGHHKVKLKELGPSLEELALLEKEIEKIAERDSTFREKMHRKRDNQHKNTKLKPPWKRKDTVHNDVKEREDGERHLDEFERQTKPKKRHPANHKRHLWADEETAASPSERRDETDVDSISKRDADIDVDDWGYCGDNGPDKWQEKWPDCGGTIQSPINLDTTTAKIDYEPILKWKGYSNVPAKMTLINNGHSIVLTASYEDCSNKPYIWDSVMNHEYVFGELTFHWGPDEKSGSEHTINYMKYPLEMQVIHYRRELGSIEKAQEVPGGVAVVAIIYHLETSKRQNHGIANIQEGFSKVRDGPASCSISPFPLSRVVPQFSKHYLSYNGSLTRPPCTETTIWLVHLKPATVSHKQLLKFHGLKNDGQEIKMNNRPIQKQNKRCVLQIT